MSSGTTIYSGNCLCFRTGETVSQLTNNHNSEYDMVYELIGIIIQHPSNLLTVSDYLAIHPEADINMTPADYLVIIRREAPTFSQLLEWCKVYDLSGDFNNFDSGWSVSMSIYS